MQFKEFPQWEEKVTEYFNSGYNCSESVFMTVLEYKGEDVGDKLKLATGFGGGMGRAGYTCGAVTGAVLAISYFHGRTGPEGDKQACYDKINLFIKEYEKEFGGANCTKYGYGKSSGRKDHDCLEFISYAVRITLNIL